jgi:hypothetical protein
MSMATKNEPLNFRKLGFASGLVFVALQLVSVAIFVTTIGRQLPPIDGPAEAYSRLYEENQTTTLLLLYLGIIAAVLLLPALGALAEIIDNTVNSRTASITLLLAGTMMVLLPISANIVEAYFGTTLALLGGDPVNIQAIDGILPVANAAAAAARALLLVVLVTTLFAAGLMGRTMRWIGVVLVVLALAGSLTVIMPGLFMLVVLGSVLFLLWFGVLLIRLLRGQDNDGSSTGRRRQYTRTVHAKDL